MTKTAQTTTKAVPAAEDKQQRQYSKKKERKTMERHRSIGLLAGVYAWGGESLETNAS